MLSDINDVKALVVGGGVSGAAIAFALANGTNLRGKDIAVIEQYSEPGSVNSHPLFNAQTVHKGPKETNYDLKRSLKMSAASEPLCRYLDARPSPLLWRKLNHMVLGIGGKEVTQLEARFTEFSPHFSDIRLAYAEEIGQLEPKVMEGRSPKQEVCAITGDAYMCNYQRLAGELLSDAMRAAPGLSARFNTAVTDVRREQGIFVVKTTKGTYRANIVIFACGAWSLDFAHRLGYGRNYGQFSLAGDFFSAGPLLNGKVYRVQDNGRPFAAPHGDADILDANDTRFGPTTKILPFLERYNYRTVDDFFWMVGRAPVRNLRAAIEILAANGNLGFVAKQWLYSFPMLGTALLLPILQEVVPTLRWRDLTRRRGAGGIRPQIVDLEKRELMFGNIIIEGEKGDNLIFASTPSPGGSKAVGNGRIIAQSAVERLGSSYHFDQTAFEYALDNPPKRKPA